MSKSVRFHSFGIRGSEVRILSPRPIKSKSYSDWGKGEKAIGGTLGCIWIENWEACIPCSTSIP